MTLISDMEALKRELREDLARLDRMAEVLERAVANEKERLPDGPETVEPCDHLPGWGATCPDCDGSK